MYEDMHEDSAVRIQFNTGSLFDLMTGKFEVGASGHVICNGGLGPFIIGSHGKGNSHKSTFKASLEMAVLKNYPDTDYSVGINAFGIDTEYSATKSRLLTFCGDSEEEMDYADSKFSLRSDPKYTIQETHKLLREICAYEAANKKELEITTPFIDVFGDKIKTSQLTLFGIDSYSQLTSKETLDFLDAKKGLEDKKFKKLAMDEGSLKTIFMTAMNALAFANNICIFTSARTGTKNTMGTTHPSRDLTHQGATVSIKDVGSKYVGLTHILYQIKRCQSLVYPGTKDSYYPMEGYDEKDLQELSLVISRNKMNKSGGELDFLVSQELGFQTTLTNLNYLRVMGAGSKQVGCKVSGGNVTCNLYPDVKFTRNNIRKLIAEDPKLAHAIDLTAWYAFLHFNRNANGFIDTSVSPDIVFDKLIADKEKLNEVLESTFIWAPLPPKFKEGDVLYGAGGKLYYSIIDVVNLFC